MEILELKKYSFWNDIFIIGAYQEIENNGGVNEFEDRLEKTITILITEKFKQKE
jgi:hypothetical protein